MSPTSGKQCITGPSYLMPGRHKQHPCITVWLLSFSAHFNETQHTPIGELIAVRADGKIGLKNIFGAFLSCEGNVRGKGCIFYFLRAATKVKASFYDQWSLRNNYPAPVDAYLTSSSIWCPPLWFSLPPGHVMCWGFIDCQYASSVCSRHQCSASSVGKPFKIPQPGANS